MAGIDHARLVDSGIAFGSGAVYGFVSVVVGQPLETVKTRMQASSSRNMLHVGSELFRKEGVRGLYRGGMPIFIGGTLFRSAQFGVYTSALEMQHATWGKKERVVGFFDLQVFAAGVCGGLGRAAVEAPFDFIKVRRQVAEAWTFRQLTKGYSVTMARNAGLFAAFVTYIDWSKQLFPDGSLGPFLTGALCSNLAWLTIWPLDVVKSQRQSGLFEGLSSWRLLSISFRDGKMYRGIVPGLSRSFLANGCAMEAYNWTQKVLQEKLSS